jgi:hypothetical protein
MASDRVSYALQLGAAPALVTLTQATTRRL